MPTARVAEILASIAGPENDSHALAVRLCQACVLALQVNGVGLALMNAEGPNGTVAATNGPAAAMEELQFATGEGPCVDASRSGRPVLQPDLARTAVRRWPGFGPAILAVGIKAIFAFPLQVGAVQLGVLDLYRDTVGDLTDDELADALSFADAATLVLLHLHEILALDGSRPDLTAVVERRAEVHQATGMISIQLGIPVADALLRLRAHAYSGELSIDEVAKDVVGRRIRFDDSDFGSSAVDRVNDDGGNS